MKSPTKKTFELLAELNVLAIEAPKNAVDIMINVFGHTKDVSITIYVDCSNEMYLKGNQPAPITDVIFELAHEKAEQFIGSAIDTANELIGERNATSEQACADKAA